MKKIFIIGLMILVLFGSSSCDKWLDLKPESEIVLDEYWKSEGDVDAVLASCYKSLTEDDVIARMIVWGELRSDNIVVGYNGIDTKRYDMYRILEGNLTPTNAYSSWGSFYSVINYCNTLLYYAPYVIDRDENFTAADLNRVKAEALSIRSLCYFYLVRSFKEVPWMDEASISDSQNYNKAKSSEDEVLNHIISDLEFAKKYVSTDFGRTDYNKGRFTLDAVNALLADIYLWKMDYANCVKSCDQILASKKLKLESPLYSFIHVFYLGNSTESIFELQFNENVQKNNMVIVLYGSSSKTYGELRFPTNLMFNPYTVKGGVYSPFNYPVPSSSTLFEGTKDIRSKQSYNINSGNIFKYAGVMEADNAAGTDALYGYRSSTPNWIIYRLSDVMLMKAEALVELDGETNLKNAITLVNYSYTRSNEGQDTLAYANYNSKPAMEDLVLRERQRELMFEGKRWYDLVRLARRENSTGTLNTFVDHKSSGNAGSLGAPVMNAMYMPISRSEIESNPKLKQNPYYATSSSN